MSPRPEVGTWIPAEIVAVRFEAGRERAILRVDQYGTGGTTVASLLVDPGFAREVSKLLDDADTVRVRLTLDVFGPDAADEGTP